MNRPRLLLPIVGVCFLLSGAASLLYEIVWAKYLALFLGSDAYAITAVLGSFMGGLAIGNFFLGRIADGLPRPLLFFGCLEMAIGGYALSFPLLYQLCQATYMSIALESSSGGVALAVKLLISMLLILPPTILMGATLPVLAKALTGSLQELDLRVSALYAVNSAGAVIGCWVADFWWIPVMGLPSTLFGGAIVNASVGVTCVTIGLVLCRNAIATGSRRSDEPSNPASPLSARDARFFLTGVGLAGFCVMLYEVAWTRLLALALGSTTHAFTLMLMAFISGIALGAAVVHRWTSLPRTISTYAWLQLGLAAALFVSMLFLDRVSLWFTGLASLLSRRSDAYPVYELLQISMCFAVTIVPMTLSGMALPVASRIATSDLAHVSRSVGKVFAVNITGTVLGSLGTGLWLMPTLGLARTFAAGIALNVAIGAALLARNRLGKPSAAWLAIPVGAIAMVIAAGWLFDETWQARLSLGLWRYREAPEARDYFFQSQRSQRIRYYRDGATATVSVSSFPYQGAEHLVLKVNAKPDASTTEDMSTQLLLGHVPMLLRPQSESVLVVGLGSGVTCGAVSVHPSVRHIDVVEISREVADAAQLFRQYNRDVLSDSRTRVFLEDAKSYLVSANRTYDVIISEPSNPWMAGVAGLFSREFYETCRRRLTPDGLMVQWLHIYEADDRMFDVVLATFASSFPHVGIWQSSATDLLLVGSAQARSVDLAALENRFQLPAVLADMKRVEITRVPVFLACEVTSAENGRFLPPSDTPLHTDLRPTLPYMAQRAWFAAGSAARWNLFDQKRSPRPRTLLAEYLAQNQLADDDFEAFAKFHFSQEILDPLVVRSLLSRWHETSKDSPSPYLLSARLALRSQSVRNAVASERESLRLAQLRDYLWKASRTDAESLRLYSRLLLQSYRQERSMFYLPPSAHLEEVLQRLVAIDSANQRLYQLQLAEVAWDRGDDRRCLELGQRAFQPDAAGPARLSFPDDPGVTRSVLTRMIETYWRAGQQNEAWNLCETAKKAGFIENAVGPRDYVLDMTYRKVIVR